MAGPRSPASPDPVTVPWGRNVLAIKPTFNFEARERDHFPSRRTGHDFLALRRSPSQRGLLGGQNV